MAKPAHKRAPTRADRVIAFIELLIVPSGEGQGGNFDLDDFQIDWIRDVYREHKGRRTCRRAILSIARKNGKGLALDTPIPTPSGWRTMADIQEGDLVYGSDGKPTRVTGVSQVNTGLRCWRLTFSDGSQIVADEQHQWLTKHSYRPWANARVNFNGSGGRWVSEVVTTPQIAASLFRQRRDGAKEHNHKICAAPELQAPAVELPIDPYVLGYWLGDGDTAGSAISAGGQDIDHICEQLAAAGYTPRRRQERTCWTVVTGTRGDRTGLTSKLRGLGLLGNKRIPSSYFDAGTEQRWALLQGLMDSDGTCSSASRVRQCQFVSVDRALAYDVWRLLRSLGIKARIREGRATFRGRDVGPDYSITFNASAAQPIFRLERKQTRLPPTLGGRSKTLSIVACDEVESVPTKCLAVAAADRLYLAGHGCVSTHNTALMAAIVLVHLVGPEAIENGEIYSAANDREQAAQVFKVAAQMVRADPELLSIVNVIDSTKTMVCYANGSFYKAMSAEAGTKHGLNPSVWIYDELAQSKNRELYDVLDTSQGARAEPLGVIISTQSNDPQHILSQLIDDGLTGGDPSIVCHLHAVPDDQEDIFDPRCWKLANPALGSFRSSEDLKTVADKARRMPGFENTFRNLYLNQRVTRHSVLAPKNLWKACANPDVALIDGEEIILALDLAGTTDLACLGAMSIESARYLTWFWKPEDFLEEHGKRDRIDYTLLAKQGLLETSPGRSIDPLTIALKIGWLHQRYRIVGLVYDRWRIDSLKRELDRAGLSFQEGAEGSGIPLYPWGQGYGSMAPALDALELLIMDEELEHQAHVLLTNHMANAAVSTDPAGNRKFDKEKSRMRIDGAQTLAMAAGKRAQMIERGAGPSVYATRGALVV